MKRLSRNDEKTILMAVINLSDPVNANWPEGNKFIYTKTCKTWKCHYVRQYNGSSFWVVIAPEWTATVVDVVDYTFEIDGDLDVFQSDMLFLKMALP